jgi:hypothetical protein
VIPTKLQSKEEQERRNILGELSALASSVWEMVKEIQHTPTESEVNDVRRIESELSVKLILLEQFLAKHLKHGKLQIPETEVMASMSGGKLLRSNPGWSTSVNNYLASIGQAPGSMSGPTRRRIAPPILLSDSLPEGYPLSEAEISALVKENVAAINRRNPSVSTSQKAQF